MYVCVFIQFCQVEFIGVPQKDPLLLLILAKGKRRILSKGKEKRGSTFYEAEGN